MQRAPDAHDTSRIHAAAYLQRPGEDDRIGLDRVEHAHLVGGSELLQQPAGIAHPTGCHHLVEHVLVVSAVAKLADEPTESVGAGALRPDETACENHCITLVHYVAAPWRGVLECSRRDVDERGAEWTGAEPRMRS